MKRGKIKILFVCKGNIFRSMTAEYCLKDFLKRKNLNGFEISSAGIKAKKEQMAVAVLKELLSKNINPRKHRQRKINKKIAENADLIIAMSEQYKSYIEEKFGKKNVVLYKKILYGKNLSLEDIDEAVPNYIEDHESESLYEKYVVNYIYKHTPLLYEKLEKYILFRGFVLGIFKHRENLPFIPLYETKNTVAFMSIDIPEKEDCHILIIPKRVYLSFNYLPKKILDELMGTAEIIGRVLNKTHKGYHILLNEGKASRHSNNHVHLHIIPRNKNDKIEMEGWRKMHLNKKKFLNLNKSIIKKIREVVNEKRRN